MPKKIFYEKGFKFEGTRLTVVENLPPKNGHSVVRCLCDCGKEWIGPASRAKAKGTKSCGCLNRESLDKRNLEHGFSKHPIERAIIEMCKRCYNPNNKRYNRYGERGIVVCDEWKNNHKSFVLWAIQSGWQKGLQIDRIDNNGPYSPDNCRWVTRSENSSNRGSFNKLHTIKGVTKNYAEWARIIGIAFVTFQKRVENGWNDDEIMLPPDIRRKVKWTHSKDAIVSS